MSRPLRVEIEGGWYHITARGHGRQKIFKDIRDHQRFLELLEELTDLHRVEVHAYALMPNHYHLLIRTPEANLSRAIQWLNQSYGTWWNLRHRGSGQVFCGRFKSIVVEGGTWILELSLYLHFNPVAIKGLGLGKKQKKAEGLGLKRPSAETVQARLETLRAHRWSSYRAYAGYEKATEWLTTGEVLRRVKGGREGYRKMAEDRMKQGQTENVWSQAKWGLVLGSERFAEEVRKKLKIDRESQGRRALKKRVGWKDVVRAVEEVAGERWGQFADRHGDWGRDMALWMGRKHTGLTLKELGKRAGGMDYGAVAMSVKRIKERASRDKELKSKEAHIEQLLLVQM